MFSLKTSIKNTAMPRMLAMMAEAKRVSGKSMEAIVAKQVKELTYNLFDQAQKIAPSREELQALPARLNHHIKRKKGVTEAQEIRRRIAHRKYVAAGWLQLKHALQGASETGRLSSVHRKLGDAIFSYPAFAGMGGHVELIDKATHAAEIHQKYGIAEKAMNATTRNMIPYIRRKKEQSRQAVLNAP